MAIREVQIRRKEATTHLPTEVVAGAKFKIGSIFDGERPLSGLTREQEKKYLPIILGIDADDREFARAVRAYWAEKAVSVPSIGTILNITEDEDGEPVKLENWIDYQWLLKHPHVASNKQSMLRDSTIRAFVHDPEKVEQSTHKKIVNRKASYLEYMKLTDGKKGDPDRMDRVVRILLGVNPNNLTQIQKENQLETVAYNDPERFYAVVTDKDIDVRAEIESMLEDDILARIGAHIKFGTDTLGHSMEEAIEFFKDRNNSATLSALRSRHAAGVKGDSVAMTDLS